MNLGPVHVNVHLLLIKCYSAEDKQDMGGLENYFQFLTAMLTKESFAYVLTKLITWAQGENERCDLRGVARSKQNDRIPVKDQIIQVSFLDK